MEQLAIVILAILWALVSASKKSKNVSQNRPGSDASVTSGAAKAPGGTTLHKTEEWKKNLGLDAEPKRPEGEGKSSLRDSYTVAQPKVEATMRAASAAPAGVSAEGRGMQEGMHAGGGSMAYASGEGVGSSAYQNVRFTAQENPDPRFEKIDRKLPVNRLRAAVVMSEILDKPVALRGKR